MKILTSFKGKFPNMTLCFKSKCIIIRYLGKLKFDKVVMYMEDKK